LRLAAERAQAAAGSSGEDGAAAAGPLILTPHGGEAARLARGARLPSFGSEVPALAVAIARAYEAVVVLKGPITNIATANGTVEAMDRGTAALAKAGTGDVLAGILGA
ncbi:NAD(P)H-hydrate dehydratase, partial [Adlercreutzia equolifaciens]|uniref:NAD(P)H-hydrate dehydratase n=1 Tax=Adlercreutzia equolifaciens TaxID=446660 RepID=UPI0023AF7596